MRLCWGWGWREDHLGWGFFGHSVPESGVLCVKRSGPPVACVGHEVGVIGLAAGRGGGGVTSRLWAGLGGGRVPPPLMPGVRVRGLWSVGAGGRDRVTTGGGRVRGQTIAWCWRGRAPRVLREGTGSPRGWEGWGGGRWVLPVKEGPSPISVVSSVWGWSVSGVGLEAGVEGGVGGPSRTRFGVVFYGGAELGWSPLSQLRGGPGALLCVA